MIAYLDAVPGVCFPLGGIHAVPIALAGAAGKHGVVFRYHTTVDRVEVSGDRAVAVHTSDGERVRADVVVLNLAIGDQRWDEGLGRRYAAELVATLEARGYCDFGAAIELSHVVTPADWARAGLAAGTPFASAHTFRQTGPFRPGNLHPRLSNMVFVGSGTQPGVGVPMVLISGKLAAQRITGAAR